MTTENTYIINNEELFVKQILIDDTKPTIIFLHDSLGCVTLWRDFPEKVSEILQVNVLVYDRLGYGKSAPMSSHIRPLNYLELEADKLIGLIEYFNLNDVWLFGHSDGASIALIAAGKYSTLFNGIIVEAGHIYVEEITLRGIRDALNAYKTTDLSNKLKKYHGDKVEIIFKAWTLTWTSEEFRLWNVQKLMENITCDLLFIQGTLDEFGSLNQVYDTINVSKGRAEMFIIPDIGHNPHKENPELILESIKKFYR